MIELDQAAFPLGRDLAKRSCAVRRSSDDQFVRNAFSSFDVASDERNSSIFCGLDRECLPFPQERKLLALRAVRQGKHRDRGAPVEVARGHRDREPLLGGDGGRHRECQAEGDQSGWFHATSLRRRVAFVKRARSGQESPGWSKLIPPQAGSKFAAKFQLPRASASA